MASGIISEGVLIIASVIVAGMITGIVISKVGSFEGTYTTTTEAQKEKMLSKFEILHVRQINSTAVDFWIKNTGLTPIQKLDSVDVYFGQINSAQMIGYNQGTTPQWVFGDSTTTSSVWTEGDTIQITLQDSSSLQSSTSYLVQVTVSNGVSDDHIFSVS
ncbi:flagellin [Nitrosopumilus sp.]|uniref:flagellin n=1 Tax=Nitrosopumilus sp. TaxID=2024843 RepID=UPI00262D8896|nr:flagellin [Nitrosopumilus sp.]